MTEKSKPSGNALNLLSNTFKALARRRVWAGVAVGLFLTTLMATPIAMSAATSSPQLSSVSVTPASATVPEGSATVFIATPSCTTSPCPAGINYSWNIQADEWWSFNGVTGSIVINGPQVVTGICLDGEVCDTATLQVHATLKKTTVTGSTQVTGIYTHFNVSLVVNPASLTLSSGHSQKISVTASCYNTGSQTSCSTSYKWVLYNVTGHLSSTTRNSVAFTAGKTAGSGFLYVYVIATFSTGLKLTVMGTCAIAIT